MAQLTQEHKDRIELWCQALESGKYRQTKQVLRSNAFHCCLGVACDISGIGKWDDDFDYITSSQAGSQVLPQEVMEWLGVENRDPYVNVNGYSFPLTDLNDSQGYSFPEIAAAIRRTYLTEVK